MFCCTCLDANSDDLSRSDDYLRGLVVGEAVGIRRITEDRYGRTVAELFLGTTNIQQEMVASGHAEIFWRYADQCPWTRRN